MYANAGVLFSNAIASCEAVAVLNEASSEAQRGHLASLIFAAISAEAFINEIGELAAEPLPFGVRQQIGELDWVKNLGDVLAQAEKSRSSTEFKYDLAKLVLTGKFFDKGSAPFQDFALLMDLRNFVVHTKPVEAVREKEAHGGWNWISPMMKKLRRWGVQPDDSVICQYVTAEDEGKITSNFLAEISSQAVAVRACEAANGIVYNILDAVPSSVFKDRLEGIYRKDFAQRPRRG